MTDESNGLTANGWLTTWVERHGRPLRILHIGNIANNAYINAKIQRQAGIEADVVCYDYYHVMGAPEWEDSDFDGDVGDDAFPDWNRVDLRGFKRPSWFVQGRLGTCRQYLLAVRSSRHSSARLLWWRLRFERWLTCRRTPLAGLARRCVKLLGAGRRRARAGSVRARAYVRLGPLRSRRALTGSRPQPPLLELATPAADPTEDIGRRFLHHFPDHTSFDAETYLAYLADTDNWKPLLAHYDVIQGYALDPAIPFVAGYPYTAYEHGTIRTIPFEATSRGQLCALAYRFAEAVFVTNSDNLAAARRLDLDPDRVVPLPHAVDSERLLRFRRASDLTPPDGFLRIFSPSRHDWVDGDLNWTKGSDRLLRGFRTFIDSGAAARLVLVEWGRDLDASRALISELGLEAYIDWLPTLRKEALWAEYLASHAIADQFVLPAFGGVTFEALALGRRVITSLDVDIAAEFFGEAPPLLVADSPARVTAALQRIKDDPGDTEMLGASAADWFARRHSSERILELQLNSYRRMLETREPRAAAAT